MIRLATHSDIPTCLSIARACGDFLRSNGIDQWTEDYPNEEILTNDVNNQELYVLDKEQSILGMIVLNESQDPEYDQVRWLTSNNSKNLVIHRLAVDPNHQGKGCAQALMAFAENLAEENNYASIRLDTFTQNKRNQRFYRKRGYKELGEIYLSYRTDFPYVCFEYVF